jgi:uncharacterized protein YkwD
MRLMALLACLLPVAVVACFSDPHPLAAHESPDKPSAAEHAHEVEIVPESAKDAKPSETRDYADVARQIAEQANEFRRAQGRGKLATNKPLTAAAKEFATYMAREHRYGHTADDRTPAERAEAQDYDYCIVLENIAYQFSTRGFTPEVLSARNSKGWEESPEHRENLLDPDVTEIGVGVAQSVDTGYYFAVQLLGRPKSAAITFELANKSDTAIQYDLDGKTYDLTPRQIRTHQRCRPPKVVAEWPKELKREPETLQPTAGDRFILENRPDGQLRFGRETREPGP